VEQTQTSSLHLAVGMHVMDHESNMLLTWETLLHHSIDDVSSAPYDPVQLPPPRMGVSPQSPLAQAMPGNLLNCAAPRELLGVLADGMAEVTWRAVLHLAVYVAALGDPEARSTLRQVFVPDELIRGKGRNAAQAAKQHLRDLEMFQSSMKLGFEDLESKQQWATFVGKMHDAAQTAQTHKIRRAGDFPNEVLTKWFRPASGGRAPSLCADLAPDRDPMGALQFASVLWKVNAQYSRAFETMRALHQHAMHDRAARVDHHIKQHEIKFSSKAEKTV